jgi:hypothetical protein
MSKGIRGGVFLVLAIVLLAAGCNRSRKEASPETKKRKAELAPQVSKRLQMIAGLAGVVKETPPVGAANPLAKAPYPARIAIVGEDWLADPARQASADSEVDLRSIPLSLCKSDVESEWVNDEDIPQMEACVNLEYVAVVRKRSLQLPQVGEDKKSFSPGRFEGDMLVFDVPKGDLVASYRLEATNTEQLELTGDPSGGDWMREAVRDLSKNSQAAAEKAFGAGATPATPPAPPTP